MQIKNRRAFHDYQILETIEAGLGLLGGEVQSIKAGRANIDHAFVRIRNNEAYLFGANIPLSVHSQIQGYDPSRIRKVLLHRQEIASLATKIRQSGLTLVPISLYNKGRLVKVQLGLGKGKREFEKKEVRKKRDIDREVEKALKDFN